MLGETSAPDARNTLRDSHRRRSTINTDVRVSAPEAEHVRVEFGEDGDSRVGLGHHERRELALFFAMLRRSAGCHVDFKGIGTKEARTNPESCAGETANVSDLGGSLLFAELT